MLRRIIDAFAIVSLVLCVIFILAFVRSLFASDQILWATAGIQCWKMDTRPGVIAFTRILGYPRDGLVWRVIGEDKVPWPPRQGGETLPGDSRPLFWYPRKYANWGVLATERGTWKTNEIYNALATAVSGEVPLGPAGMRYQTWVLPCWFFIPLTAFLPAIKILQSRRLKRKSAGPSKVSGATP